MKFTEGKVTRPSNRQVFIEYRDRIRKEIAEGQLYRPAVAEAWFNLTSLYADEPESLEIITEIFTLLRLAQKD